MSVDSCEDTLTDKAQWVKLLSGMALGSVVLGGGVVSCSPKECLFQARNEKREKPQDKYIDDLISNVTTDAPPARAAPTSMRRTSASGSQAGTKPPPDTVFRVRSGQQGSQDKKGKSAADNQQFMPTRKARRERAKAQLNPTAKTRPKPASSSSSAASPTPASSSTSTGGAGEHQAQRQRPLTLFTQRQAARMLVCGMLKDKKKQRMEARQQGRAQATAASCRGFLEKDEAAVTQMLGWVTRLMQAAMHDESKLPSLLSEAHQLRPGAVAVQVTGGGVALATRWIWESLDMARQKRRIQLLKTWRIKIREEVSAVKALAGKALLPAGTKKSQLLQSNWTEKLNEIIAFFKTVESQDEATRIHCSRLGIRLVLAGFKAIDELAGLPMSALPKLTTNPREQAMLARAVQDE